MTKTRLRAFGGTGVALRTWRQTFPAAGSITEDYLRSRGLDLPVGREPMAGEDFAAVFEKLGTDWRSGITIKRGTA